MMGLLYKKDYDIDFISMKIPSVGEIIENESEYYDVIALLIATPYDMMVQLDKVKIDYTTISDWELFCYIFGELKNRNLSLIFNDLDLNNFDFALDEQDNVVLLNKKTGHVIDRALYKRMGNFLREIHFLEKNNKTPANEEAKLYLLERAKKAYKRSMRKNNKQPQSQLERLIIALVNTKEFPYDYSSVLDLSIYQFNASLKQIIKRVNFDNLMIGYYTGNIDIKGLNADELNWILN